MRIRLVFLQDPLEAEDLCLVNNPLHSEPRSLAVAIPRPPAPSIYSASELPPRPALLQKTI
ncbi:hypothetical protein BKA56DRAFT_599787 [Ilyonectria sp. MPI-CAGE-AT-0026]|nr:hypothetical protein BKA56DRAFT_599787 [Ilyonectria sp. MPI-CAGE-AT-0026]